MSKKDKSIFGPTVIMRVQLLVTAAEGAVTLPEGGTKGYVHGLFNRTDEKSRLKVVAVTTEDRGATIQVGITNRQGLKSGEFTIKQSLTRENAMNTGKSIAKLLGDPNAAAMCGRKLLELASRAENGTATFTLGTNKRLMITDGGE